MVLVVTCNCGFAENRRSQMKSTLRIRRKNRTNRRKSTPQGRKNSPKSGDDRIDQVFSYVIAGSNGFQRVAVLPIGSVRKAAVHDSRRCIFRIFFKIFSPRGASSPFQTERARAHTHKKKWTHVYIYRRR